MKYEQHYENAWYEVRPRRGYKVACCDCGLVHRNFFRVRAGRLEWRVRVDRRATAQVRRHLERRQKRG